MLTAKEQVLKALERSPECHSVRAFTRALGYRGSVAWSQLSPDIQIALSDLKDEGLISYALRKVGRKTFFSVVRLNKDASSPKAEVPQEKGQKIERALYLLSEAMRDEYEAELRDKDAQIANLKRELDDNDEQHYLSKIFKRKN